MIIDFHTHIFPPDVRDRRDDYVRRHPTFAEMYANPKAKIATAEDLLASMDQSGVDISVALGFAWRDHDDIVRHNDYLLEKAAESSGRIIPFTTINMADARAGQEIERCAKAGARGLGELRPDNQAWDLNGPGGELLSSIAKSYHLALLFHVTEPGNRSYPGHRGLEFESFRTFADGHPDLKIIGAHLGGGYFSYKGLRAAPYVDTAALAFLHPGEQAIEVLKRIPAHRILFGSDFPLITQARQLEELKPVLPPDCFDAALSENAQDFLGL